MKKFLTILVAFTVMVCSTASANEIDPKSPVGMGVIKNGSVYKVFYKGAKSADVKITITDSEGKVVFKETLRNIQNFMRPYNFATVDEGKYSIVLEGENGKQQENITYTIDGKSKRTMSLIRLAGASNKYVLSIPNQGSEALKIKIYRNDHSIVYSATEQINGDFAKLYNLDKIGEDFFFEVTGKNGASQVIFYGKK